MVCPQFTNRFFGFSAESLNGADSSSILRRELLGVFAAGVEVPCKHG